MKLLFAILLTLTPLICASAPDGGGRADLFPVEYEGTYVAEADQTAHVQFADITYEEAYSPPGGDIVYLAAAQQNVSDPSDHIESAANRILAIIGGILLVIDVILRLFPSVGDNTLIGNILKWLAAISDFLNRRKNSTS